MSKRKAQLATVGYTKSIGDYTVTALSLRPISRKGLHYLGTACGALAVILQMDCPAITQVTFQRVVCATPVASYPSANVSRKRSG
jgi:hypothetical protein